MYFSVLTLFPEFINAFFATGMIARGIEKQLISGSVINIRDYAFDKHHTVDDKPYGGGSGMVMKPEPLKAAVIDAKKACSGAKVLLMTPQGVPFNQNMAAEMSVQKQGLIFVCGRYEGIDERFYATWVDGEVSIGDYVMTGGEIAAMAMIDAVARLIPGVLGSPRSPQSDSFVKGRLEYAHYTRPEKFQGLKVPKTLLSGNHGKIRQWRKNSALQRTLLKRPDLFNTLALTKAEKKILKSWCQELKALVGS